MQEREFTEVAKQWLDLVSPLPWKAIVWPQRSKWTQLWKVLKVFFATWKHSGKQPFYEVMATLPSGEEVTVCHTGAGPTSEKNAMMIAWIINNLPAIISELERAKESPIGRKNRWA